MDLGGFEARVDFRLDLDQLPFPAEQVEVGPEIGEWARGTQGPAPWDVGTSLDAHSSPDGGMCANGFFKFVQGPSRKDVGGDMRRQEGRGSASSRHPGR